MLRTIAALASAGMMLTAMAASPASAEDAPAPTNEDHCVHDLEENTLVCFETFTEAMAEASGGKITDAPTRVGKADADLDDRIEALADEIGPQSHIVLAISYAGQNHTGATLTSTGHTTCSSSNFYHGDLSQIGSGWGDRIRSFKSYANCRITLYNFRWCTLANRTWSRNQQPATLGAFDRKSMSMYFSYNLPPGDTCL